MEILTSGTVVELTQDWVGSSLEPPKERKVKLIVGTRLRVFTHVDDSIEVFIQGQAALYRIPAHILKKVSPRT